MSGSPPSTAKACRPGSGHPASAGPDALAINAERLDRYLASSLPEYAGPLSVTRLVGGASNPTYLLEAGEAGYVRRQILRKKPPGTLLPSAHQVEREYRVMAALRGSAVPVPPTRLLCEDPSVIGTAFYLMDYLEGRIFRDPRLPGLDPKERAAIYRAFVECLAALHRIDPASVGLADLGRPGNYFERQIARWANQYRASDAEPVPAMETLIEALPRRMPADSSAAIAHGDFRLENMIFHPTEPRILAVLDWELCTLGSPLADLGYACIGYHADIDSFGTLLGVDHPRDGIPDEAALVEHYCQSARRERIEDLPFYISFGLFRLAAIAHGVYQRSLAGNATGHWPGHNQAPYIAGRALAVLTGEDE